MRETKCLPFLLFYLCIHVSSQRFLANMPQTSLSEYSLLNCSAEIVIYGEMQFLYLEGLGLGYSYGTVAKFGELAVLSARKSESLSTLSLCNASRGNYVARVA